MSVRVGQKRGGACTLSPWQQYSMVTYEHKVAQERELAPPLSSTQLAHAPTWRQSKAQASISAKQHQERGMFWQWITTLLHTDASTGDHSYTALGTTVPLPSRRATMRL